VQNNLLPFLDSSLADAERDTRQSFDKLKVIIEHSSKSGLRVTPIENP